MGCTGSSNKHRDEDLTDSSNADRQRIFTEAPLIKSLFGDAEDLRALCSLCVISKSLKFYHRVALAIVIHGEIHATLSRDEKLKPRAKIFRRGDIIPFFLHGSNFTTSSDGNAFCFGNNEELKLRFRFHNSKGAVGGTLLVLSRDKLESYLAARPQLTGLKALINLDAPKMLQSCKELAGISDAYAHALTPLMELRPFAEGDLLLHWTASTSASKGNRSLVYNEIDSSDSVSKCSEKDSITDSTGCTTGVVAKATSTALILMGGCTVIKATDDIADLLAKFTHHYKGTHHSNAHASGAGSKSNTSALMTAPLKNAKGTGPAKICPDAVDWATEGTPKPAGSIIGIECAFMRPASSIYTIFANSSGVMASISHETCDAIGKLDLPMMKGWIRGFCHNVLTEFKSTLPVLAGVTQEDINYMAGKVELLTVPPGIPITVIGEQADTLHIVIDGEIEESCPSLTQGNFASSNPAVLRFLHAGAYFGDINLVTEQPYAMSRKSVTNTTILALRKSDFLHVFQNKQKSIIDIKLRAMGGETELINILRHVEGFEMFHMFLRGEFATENIDFWKVTDRFENKARQLQKSIIVKNLALTRTATTSTLTSEGFEGEEEEKSAYINSDSGYNNRISPAGMNNQLLQLNRTDIMASLPLTQQTLFELASEIVSEFVSNGANQLVNIGHGLQEQILQGFDAWAAKFSQQGKELADSEGRLHNVDEPIVRLFAAANKEVYELLRKDAFQRWKSTPAFTTFIRSLKNSKDCGKARRVADVRALMVYKGVQPVTNMHLQAFKEKSIRQKSFRTGESASKRMAQVAAGAPTIGQLSELSSMSEKSTDTTPVK